MVVGGVFLVVYTVASIYNSPLAQYCPNKEFILVAIYLTNFHATAI